VGTLLAIVIAVIVYGTLYPFHFHFARTSVNPFFFLVHAWPEEIDRFVLRDMALNVAFFVPLGVSAFLTFARRGGRTLGILCTILLAATLSASIEMLQIYDATRDCSALDWLCNTLGALLGGALALVFQPRLASIALSAGRRGASAAALLAGCWAGAQLYPPIPIFSRGHLRATWAHFIATHVSVSTM